MARLGDYFGERDASVDFAETLTAQHVFRDIEKRIKWGKRTSGKQVVVGVKGSGKTELRRCLESKRDAHVVNFDADHTFFSQDVAAIGESSGRTKNAVAAILLREFARRFSESKSSKTANALKAALHASADIVKKVPSAIDVTVPGATLKLGELLRRDAASVLQSTLDRLVADVVAALREEDEVGAILIDDVEDVFPGITENPLFLEGVARAVADINHRGGDRLHAVLFVKHGLWRSWFERAREYDRVASVIDFLTWDHDALVELIAKRIAYRRNMGAGQSLDVEKIWAKEFSWSGAFETFTRYCTQHCVSGPRDMVALCNLAAAKPAEDEHIARKHIEASLGAYSEQKVFGLNGDFGDTYADIPKFVEQAFQGADAQMTGQQLADLIETRTLLNSRFHDDFKNNKRWYPAARVRLALIMYQIGVVGYESPRGVIYAIEDPNLSSSELLDKAAVCVHPAFHPHLNIA